MISVMPLFCFLCDELRCFWKGSLRKSRCEKMPYFCDPEQPWAARCAPDEQPVARRRVIPGTERKQIRWKMDGQ